MLNKITVDYIYDGAETLTVLARVHGESLSAVDQDSAL